MVSASSPEPRKRPRSLTAVSYLFIAAGLVGFAYHATEFNTQEPISYGWVGVLLIRLLAVATGVLMLRGVNEARWLALAWIGYHVILSALHSWSETAMHAVLLAGVAYVLLSPAASAYFRAAKPQAPP